MSFFLVEEIVPDNLLFSLLQLVGQRDDEVVVRRNRLDLQFLLVGEVQEAGEGDGQAEVLPQRSVQLGGERGDRLHELHRLLAAVFLY